ncbi:MAG: multidrug ABC transporter substrate-binding protein [Campylobacteraceae bacterium 4484_4]|nr:MAG: multidrug ABC transporter substrate-binding protein [Campylobacteraceae bacterium 4484_4]
MFINAFLLALREIRRNLMRSLLTMIGIVIGIASVIAMVNIAKGASLSVTESVSKLGSRILYIVPGQARGMGGQSTTARPFEPQETEVLKKSVYAIEAVSGVENTTLTAMYRDRNYHTGIRGVEGDFLTIQEWKIASGRAFEKSELRSGQSVCIIGQTVLKKLFGSDIDPIGKRIRLEHFSCTIIGTLAKKGANTFGMDQDDVILVPLKMFQRRIGGTNKIRLIMASVKKGIPLDEATLQIRRILREQRHLPKDAEDDFSIFTMQALLSTISDITTILTVMLGFVAAISLVVGGIGIMNIMLVSVTERTREIGIRLAVGATSDDILTQFLIEAIVLSALGGMIGILLGLFISWIVSKTLQIALVVDPMTITVALVVSMGIGILFGFIPARKAARKNPIEALRYE